MESEARNFLRTNSNPKVYAIFVAKAGERLEYLASRAYNLVQAYEKTAERAMADVLESHKK